MGSRGKSDVFRSEDTRECVSWRPGERNLKNKVVRERI